MVMPDPNIFHIFQENLHEAMATIRDLLTSDSRKSFKEVVDRLPPSEYSMRVWTGTRVPRNTGVPPMISGLEVMRGCAGWAREIP